MLLALGQETDQFAVWTAVLLLALGHETGTAVLLLALGHETGTVVLLLALEQILQVQSTWTK
jgi:hypothetical protein